MNQGEGNKYDKIWKEIAEQFFLPLVATELDLTITSFRPLTMKLQKTLEREVDFLYELILPKGEKMILHLEFEIHPDKNLLIRMKEYNAIISKKLDMPVQHIVVHLGEKTQKITNQLEEEHIFRGFGLIDFKQMSYERFLQSDVPEIVIMAILSNVAPDERQDLVDRQITRLKELSESPAMLRKYINQLLVISQLRKLETVINSKISGMGMILDIRENHYFKEAIKIGHKEGLEKGLEEGLEKGEEKGKSKFKSIVQAILDGHLSVEQIALKYDEKVEEVENLRLMLNTR